MDITSPRPHNGLSTHPEPSPLSPTSSTISSTSSSIPTKKKPSKKAAVSKPRTSTAGNRGERMTFELDDVLRKYSPEQFKTCKAYDVGGVNILNKKPIDSKTALDKIKRRRETHNRVERRRRDCINQASCLCHVMVDCPYCKHPRVHMVVACCALPLPLSSPLSPLCLCVSRADPS